MHHSSNEGKSMAASTGTLLTETGFGCSFLCLADSVPYYEFCCLDGNGPECSVPMENELKGIFLTLFFQSSFAIYSELHTLSWTDVTEATDRGFLCAYPQPLRPVKCKISLFCLLVYATPKRQFSVSHSSGSLL